MNQHTYQQGVSPYQRSDHNPPSDAHARGSSYRNIEEDASLAQNSYDFNKAVIPGLGLGFSVPTQPKPSQASLFVRSDQQSFPATSSPKNILPGEGGATKAAQEIDLSEGELEDDDIYEPSADDHGAAPLTQGAPGFEQERAASYSPAFSAGEVDEPTEIANRPSSTSFPQHDRSQCSLPTEHGNHVSVTDKIKRVREEACAAISSLRLLDLSQQVYLDYNIDKSVLESLFRELGLSVPSQTAPHAKPPIAQATPTTTTTKSPTPPMVTSQPEVVATPPIKSNLSTSKTVEPKDSSESRKDRIARLLAAKGSRQASVAHSPASPAANEGVSKGLDGNGQEPQHRIDGAVPPSSRTSVKSAEKSMLLQQKMEALRRARESKAAPVSSSVRLQGNGQQAKEFAGDVNLTASGDTSVRPQTLVSSGSSSPKGPTVPRTSGVKRPVAADFETPSYALASKRQFGQPQETRSFLIHVSDDEDDTDDDAEMGIETPGKRSHSHLAGDSETSLLKNHPPLSDNSYRGPKSPANAVGRAHGIIGSENLSKMYKNIEEMKRRIREAEASKQAKASRQGTPLDTPIRSNSEAGLAGTVVNYDTPLRDSPVSSAAGHSPRESTALSGAETASPQSRPLPRRSLSRSAQERLTSIESDRKNKELKMRIMRAKIAQMEKEMAASRQEEEALYEQVDSDKSGDGATEAAASSLRPALGIPAMSQSVVAEAVLSPVDHVASVEAAISATRTENDSKTEREEIAQRKEDAAPIAVTEDISKTAESGTEASEMFQDEDEDEDAEMKDLTEEDSSDTDSGHGPEPVLQTTERSRPTTGSAENDDSDVAGSVHAAGDSSSESDPISESTESNQQQSQGSNADQEPPRTVFEGADQSDEDTRAAEIDDDADIHRRPDVTQNSEIDALMDVTQPEHVDQAHDSAVTAKAGFRPYESALSYFHAYRFHPEFQKAVKGGLRSLTYSNKIDVQKPMCPDELAGQSCPRGSRCNFQHLNQISTPDDQILMQLGSYGAREGDEQERFNDGLRKLLQELKSRDSQDFSAISQAIIDYRAQFHGDRSKILPLGNVSL